MLPDDMAPERLGASAPLSDAGILLAEIMSATLAAVFLPLDQEIAAPGSMILVSYPPQESRFGDEITAAAFRAGRLPDVPYPDFHLMESLDIQHFKSGESYDTFFQGHALSSFALGPLARTF
jgi:hypothetical protein